jgi:hypothetical protein
VGVVERRNRVVGLIASVLGFRSGEKFKSGGEIFAFLSTVYLIKK